MNTQSLSCYGAEMTPERWQQLDEMFQSRENFLQALSASLSY